MMGFETWSKKRLVKWTRRESYHSPMGMVVVNEVGDWVGKVCVGDKVARLAETFVSAKAAMEAVERTWKREEEKRNGKGVMCSGNK